MNKLPPNTETGHSISLLFNHITIQLQIGFESQLNRLVQVIYPKEKLFLVHVEKFKITMTFFNGYVYKYKISMFCVWNLLP